MGKIFNVKDSAIVREEVLAIVKNAFPDSATILVASGEIAVPVVGPDGEAGFAKVAVSVPKGGRGGTGWVPQEDAEAYLAHLAEQEQKREQAAAKKALKIAKDKAAREAKAASK